LHHLDVNWLMHPTVRRLAELRLQAAGAANPADLAPVLDAVGDDAFARQLVTEAASERRALPQLDVQLADATRRLRDAWIDRQIALLGARLADTALPDDQRLAVLRDQQQLRAWKRTPLQPLGES
jgi:hypothetical protein